MFDYLPAGFYDVISSNGLAALRFRGGCIGFFSGFNQVFLFFLLYIFLMER